LHQSRKFDCDRSMLRQRPPYLSHEKTRHGKNVWYFRRGGRRLRLRSQPGTPDFEVEYQAALSGEAPPRRGAAPGTLAWLVERYRETVAWQTLAYATRRQRENIFRHVLEGAGAAPYRRITAATMEHGLERRAATPSAARNFLDSMRGLFVWAKAAGLVAADPTAGVKAPRRRKSSGFRPWTEADVEAYEACWPIGTRQRVWLDVLLYTGLRRGDVVQLGRQHVRDGVATIKTEKSQETVEVTLPILAVLARTLAAGPCGDLTFICGERRRPLTKEAFGNMFKAACKAAGVPGSAHGVRKIAATRAANAGATEAELEAIFGWRGGRMASLYTREANRRRLAQQAMSKLDENRTKTVAPSGVVRQLEQKDQ